MYAWIWSKLPFGLPGKIIGSLALTLGAAALFWFVVFPWAEPILPFDDVQVGTEAPVGGGEPDPGIAPGAGPTPSADDPFAIPYDTESNNPAPTKSR